MGCGCARPSLDPDFDAQPATDDGRTLTLHSWHLTTEAGGPREPNRTMHEEHLRKLHRFLQSAHRSLREEVTIKRCCDELRTAVAP